MELPHWVRVELALAAWWVVWSAALAHFLYYGRRISDDHVYQGPRDWLATFRRPKTPAGSGAAGSSWGEVGSWTVPEGCALAIGVVLVAVLVFFLTWLLIEVVFPVLAIMLYGLIRGMLAKVANDQHGCNGRFGAAFLWGSIWATVYTAPLALLVWVVHMIVQYRAAG
jgi:hypothetical protein